MKIERYHFGSKPRAVKYLGEEGYVFTNRVKDTREVWLWQTGDVKRWASLEFVTLRDRKGEFTRWEATLYDR